MNVVYVSGLYPPHVRGGAELVLQTQAQAMAARGHTVTVLTLGAQPGPSCEEQLLGGVRVLRAGYRNAYFHAPGIHPSAAKRALWHWRDRRNEPQVADIESLLGSLSAEIVCVHGLAGWSIALWSLLRRLALPCVQVLHDQYLLCATAMMYRNGRNCQRQCAPCRLLRWRHAQASAQVDAVVGVSRYVLDKLLQAGYFSGARVREVLYNTSAQALPAPRAEPASGGRPPRFGFIGTLTGCKGIEPLLQSVQASSEPALRLRIAGSGVPRYEQMLRAKYADPRIEFVGYVQSPAFLSSIDVAIVPSLWHDTLPSVVFEALGAGVSVIGARRGGIPEMVRDGHNGLLFEPQQPGALLDCLLRLLREPALLGQLARNTRESARSFYDLPAWVAGHEAILQRTLELRGSHDATTLSAMAPIAPGEGVLSCEG